MEMVTRAQTKEELRAIIAQKDLQIVELKKHLDLSHCQVAKLKESHRKSRDQGYQQGLVENSRLLIYLEKKASKLMCRLSEYEILHEDLFTGKVVSDDEGVREGSEEKPGASPAQWSIIKPIFNMLSAMKATMGFENAQEGEDKGTPEKAASKMKFEDLGDHPPGRKMPKED
ncbi:hypothetical protein B9Z55_007307 [Caenorhabditis nigoni]|nr:hypothetical protein B9Z55_007307 [Caenorhabditis nigoni]